MTRRRLPRCPQANCNAKSTRCVKHSMLRSRLRSQRRYKCLACKKTFAANVGTPYHRMRHSPKKFDEVVALAVEGNSKAAITRALDLTPGTVSRWLERASDYATAFSDVKVNGLHPMEFQSDELRAQARNKKQPLLAYTSVEVWSRLWTSTLVGRRTLHNTLHHFRDMKQRCRYSGSKVLIATDSFHYNAEVIAHTFGPTCVHVQVKKRYQKGRVVHTEKVLVIGTDDDFLEAMSRSEDSKTINTSYVERLNLTIRRSIACLQRKTNAMCRSERSLTEQLELLRCYYNFLRPHSSLKFGRVMRTPAQQAGLVPKRLTWRKIFTARILDGRDESFQSRMRARAVGQAHQNCLE